MNIKKIITYVLIAVLLIVGLFTLTGCGADKTEGEPEVKAPVGKKLSFTTSDKKTWDFYYPENAGIEVEDTSETYKTLKDTEENYKMEITLNSNTVYESDKQENKDYFPETYKEFTLGGYEAYSYSTTSCFYVFVLLEKSDDWFTTFEIELDPVSQAGNEDNGADFYANNEEVKSIINSLTYSEPAPAETAE